MAFEPEWLWLVAGVALAIAELMVPGVFLIWIGAAAAITGLLALTFALPLAAELGLFTVAAIVAVLASRHYFERSPVISDDPLLNERTARLIGRIVTVVEPIEHGEGRVRVHDGVWTACGPDASVGERVRVVGARGSRLEVEPIGLLS
jgi:inner membrane protein